MVADIILDMNDLQQLVVICLKISIFAWSQTSGTAWSFEYELL